MGEYKIGMISNDLFAYCAALKNGAIGTALNLKNGVIVQPIFSF